MTWRGALNGLIDFGVRGGFPAAVLHLRRDSKYETLGGLGFSSRMLVLLPRHNWFTSSLFAVKSCITKSAICSELAGREARHSVEMYWRRGLSTTAENDWKSVSVVAEA